jgi:peptidoglycan hydrolase-like protein with peptidoglycan-binding domain
VTTRSAYHEGNGLRACSGKGTVLLHNHVPRAAQRVARTARIGHDGAMTLRGARHAAMLGLVVVVVGGCGSGPEPAGAPPSRTTASADPTASPANTAVASGSPSTAASPAPRPSPKPTPSHSPSVKPSAGSDGKLTRGESGPEIVALQRRLAALGYWNGTADGEFGQLTTQAVYALQKAAGLDRDGTVGPKTREALDRGVRPKAKSKDGNRIEIDLKRQLLMIVDDGAVTTIFNTSTGSNENYEYEGETYLADTPTGKFTVSRQIDGWRHAPLGELYRPKYFNGGIAVHGAYSIPPYPASHGCARLSIAAMDWLWNSGRVPVGMSVWVY